MSHVISMHRPGDPRQTAVSDFSKVILPCLMVPRFEDVTLVGLANQHNHSAVGVMLPTSRGGIAENEVTS
jgi:hypothetical protein